ncbi:MAG TPA: hypothetical protein VEG28_00895 [Dehalococcoidia bacterium]|nr:hypothetical protein [Dehalococcoidia bacterium]
MTSYKKIVAMTIAMLFVMSLGSVAVAKGTYSLKGEVLSVDKAANMLTVKAINTTSSSPTRFKGDVPFVTNDMTKVTMGKKHETLANLKTGDMVKVVFHEKSGKEIADRIVVNSQQASEK